MESLPPSCFLLVPSDCRRVQHLVHSSGDVWAFRAQVSSLKPFQSLAAGEDEALGTVCKADVTSPPGYLGSTESLSQAALGRREAMLKNLIFHYGQCLGEVLPQGPDFNMPEPGGKAQSGVSRHSARLGQAQLSPPEVIPHSWASLWSWGRRRLQRPQQKSWCQRKKL